MLNHWIDASRVLLDVVENQPDDDDDDDTEIITDALNIADIGDSVGTNRVVRRSLNLPITSPAGSGRSTPDREYTGQANQRSMAGILRTTGDVHAGNVSLTNLNAGNVKRTDTPRRSLATLRRRNLPRISSTSSYRRAVTGLGMGMVVLKKCCHSCVT